MEPGEGEGVEAEQGLADSIVVHPHLECANPDPAVSVTDLLLEPLSAPRKSRAFAHSGSVSCSLAPAQPDFDRIARFRQDRESSVRYHQIAMACLNRQSARSSDCPREEGVSAASGLVRVASGGGFVESFGVGGVRVAANSLHSPPSDLQPTRGRGRGRSRGKR